MAEKAHVREQPNVKGKTGSHSICLKVVHELTCAVVMSSVFMEALGFGA
jgi:hypothetical protein